MMVFKDKHISHVESVKPFGPFPVEPHKLGKFYMLMSLSVPPSFSKREKGRCSFKWCSSSGCELTGFIKR